MYHNTKDKDITNIKNKDSEFQVDCSNLEIGCLPACLTSNYWLNMFSFSSRRSNLEVNEQISGELLKDYDKLKKLNSIQNTSICNDNSKKINFCIIP